MTSIKRDDILKCIDYSTKNDLINDLNNIYSNLPKGMCSGCGSCCMESVGISLIEFINIYNYLINKDELRKICLDKVIDYYFNEYVKKSSCPFKDDNNRCMIYEVRPLNCRLFGHWKEEDYNRNLNTVNDRNREYKDIMKEKYSIDINEEVVNYKIRYCYDFKPENGYLTKTDRLNFSDNIMILDSKLLSNEIIDIDFKDRGVVEYFIESMMNEDVAYSMKVKVTQEDIIRDRTINRLKRALIR